MFSEALAVLLMLGIVAFAVYRVTRLTRVTVKMREEGAFERVGTVGVDAGMLMVVDPCYVLHRKRREFQGHEGGLDPAFGKDWPDFCDAVMSEPGSGPEHYPVCKTVAQVQSKEPGSWVSAVVVGGFGGDGRYPVYVKHDGRGNTRAILVDFEGPSGEDLRGGT